MTRGNGDTGEELEGALRQAQDRRVGEWGRGRKTSNPKPGTPTLGRRHPDAILSLSLRTQSFSYFNILPPPTEGGRPRWG